MVKHTDTTFFLPPRVDVGSEPGTGLDHDHTQCVSAALGVAAQLCVEREQRLTPIRRRVLELIWRSHQPVGAYALLDLLRADGRRAAPPTVYRALEFLLDQRLIHRIDTLNAFLGCVDPRHPHQGQYLICDRCRTVTEIADGSIVAVLEAGARSHGFTPRRQSVEISGLCRNCL